MLARIVQHIDRVNEWLGRAAAWLLVPLILLVSFDVLARKLFNFSEVWIMDVEWHLFSLIFLLAAGYTLKQDQHVRVDLFYEKFEKKEKAWVDFLGTLFFLIPWSVVVIAYSYGYAFESFRIGENSSEPGGLPARYVIKFFITFSVFILLLQALSLLYKAGRILFSRKDYPPTGNGGAEQPNMHE